MISNYLKTAFRNLVKQKYYSIVNVLGLAFGIAASVLIFLWINHELSYDRFYDDYNNIYRITSEGTVGGQEMKACTTPSPLANKLAEISPEVICATRITQYYDRNIKYNNHLYKEKRIISADTNFFKVFSFNFIEGDAEKPFLNKNSIILTNSMAQKYFGDEKAMGKVLLVNGNDPYIVSAVIEDLPTSSHIHFNMIFLLDYDDHWARFNWLTYILLKDDHSKGNIKVALDEIVENHINVTLAGIFGISMEQFKDAGNTIELGLQPLKSIHLESDLYGELENNGNKTYVIFFFVIAIFILLIACINYMNLSTAYYDTRVVEVGIRKSNGATRSKLIKQFLTESILISTAAFILGITIMESFLPFFKSFLGISMNDNLSKSWLFWLIVFAAILVIGMLSGIYPAAYLSGKKTVSVIRKQLYSPGKKSFSTRSFLVVFQFAITITIITAAIFIRKQVNFLLDKDLGFKKEQLVIIEGANDLGNNREVFKSDLKKNSNILNLCYSGTYPGDIYNEITNYRVTEYSPDQQFLLKTIYVDPDFLDTYNMKMIQGRKFNVSDNDAIILNEKAIDIMKLDNPLNNHIAAGDRTVPVVGVVHNFHHEPLNTGLDPMQLRLVPAQYLTIITIRIAEGHVKDAMDDIAKKWGELTNNKPFEFSFLDSKLQSVYNAEMKAGRVFSIFSVLSIIIACMGILGIASYLIQRRIKEIGIRKANGAKTSEVTIMFFKYFLKWVVIAFLVACPVAWFVMNKWLQHFAYKINLSWWVFLSAGLLSLTVAILTISWQSWRAASRNPVEALRYE